MHGAEANESLGEAKPDRVEVEKEGKASRRIGEIEVLLWPGKEVVPGPSGEAILGVATPGPS